MGCVDNIYKGHFPKQDSKLGKLVRVYYHYNTKQIDYGILIRHDVEMPFETIIQLDNGNVVRDTECQWSIV